MELDASLRMEYTEALELELHHRADQELAAAVELEELRQTNSDGGQLEQAQARLASMTTELDEVTTKARKREAFMDRRYREVKAREEDARLQSAQLRDELTALARSAAEERERARRELGDVSRRLEELLQQRSAMEAKLSQECATSASLKEDLTRARALNTSLMDELAKSTARNAAQIRTLTAQLAGALTTNTPQYSHPRPPEPPNTQFTAATGSRPQHAMNPAQASFPPYAVSAGPQQYGAPTRPSYPANPHFSSAGADQAYYPAPASSHYADSLRSQLGAPLQQQYSNTQQARLYYANVSNNSTKSYGWRAA